MVRGGLCAVAFTPAGTLVIATRYGEIWMQDTALKTWRRFARGLNEPIGLVAESDRVVYIAHRPELLRVEDTDGDGEADWFKSIGGHWGLTHNYHEFFYGLRRDAAGNFYGAISLDSQGEGGAKREATDIKADPRAAHVDCRRPRGEGHAGVQEFAETAGDAGRAGLYSVCFRRQANGSCRALVSPPSSPAAAP